MIKRTVIFQTKNEQHNIVEAIKYIHFNELL